MKIVSVAYALADNSAVHYTLENENGERHWAKLGTARYSNIIQPWIDAGGVIAPYSEPPEPSLDEKMERAFPVLNIGPKDKIIFEALFELAQSVQPSLTRSQYRNHLKSFLSP